MTTYEQEILDLIKKAMTGENLISFIYDEKNRIVEPYLLGELYNKHQNHLEEGTFALRAWFVNGYTSEPVDLKKGDRWRVYELQKIQELKILSVTNHNLRPLYNPNDSKFKRIIFNVNVK